MKNENTKLRSMTAQDGTLSDVKTEDRFLVRSEKVQDSQAGEQAAAIIRSLCVFCASDVDFAKGSGRGHIQRFQSPNGRTFIFRAYFRGGMVRHFLTRCFVSLGAYRPFVEYAMLRGIWEAGCSVPEPVAAVVERRFAGLLYRGAIALAEIPNTENLLEIVRGNGYSSPLDHVCFTAGREAARVLSLGVQHTDLHLGNVLFDSSRRVFLIDFDKARSVQGQAGKDAAAEKILERFYRSAVKHDCPQAYASFAEGFGNGQSQGAGQ